jgi:hypothetical protein
MGGNPTALDELNRERDAASRNALLQSQLESQALDRQQRQQEMSGYQTPAQKQQMQLDTEGKLLQLQRQNAAPELIPITGPDGQVKYYQRKYNQATGDYDITPAMATTDQVISSPDNPQIPYDPTKTVTRSQRSQLTSQNPDIFKSRLDLQKQIDFATDPRVQQSRIDVASAEGRARASLDADISRGSNAALAKVPPHLVPAATAAATKASQEYADAKSVSDRMAATMDAARRGNVVSYQIIPTEGTLQITTSQGVHRINRAEIDQYAGGGSLWQRMVGHFGKSLSGESIPDSVLNDMNEIQQIQAQGAQSRYANKLKTINQNYGSNFQPVEMGGLNSGGNRPPLSSFEH